MQTQCITWAAARPNDCEYVGMYSEYFCMHSLMAQHRRRLAYTDNITGLPGCSSRETDHTGLPDPNTAQELSRMTWLDRPNHLKCSPVVDDDRFRVWEAALSFMKWRAMTLNGHASSASRQKSSGITPGRLQLGLPSPVVGMNYERAGRGHSGLGARTNDAHLSLPRVARLTSPIALHVTRPQSTDHRLCRGRWPVDNEFNRSHSQSCH